MPSVGAAAPGGASLCFESSRDSYRLGCRDGCGWLVEGAVPEHRGNDVAAASGQADHGGVVGFLLGSFAIVAGLGDQAVV